jgi:hypothetical protein
MGCKYLCDKKTSALGQKRTYGALDSITSALGQTQTFAAQKAMSTLPLKADIGAAFEMSAKGQKRTL